MMCINYDAFGLTLRSSFPLPGLVPASEEALPECELTLETPLALRAAWSGPVSPSPWRGNLGDGSRLTIEWGEAGDLLVCYGGSAWFRLEPGFDRLSCAPTDASAVAWQRVLLSRVLPLVALAHGYEALHAGAVETPAGVVVVVGPSGAGKSTLVSELLRRGHRLFADDVLVIGSKGTPVRAYPGSPHLSLTQDLSPEPVGEILGLFGGKRWIAVENAARKSRPVVTIAILERGRRTALEIQPIAASPLALAPFMLGLPDDEGRDASRFALYSDLVESARLVRLTGSLADRPGDLADLIESTLDLSSPASVGRAA